MRFRVQFSKTRTTELCLYCQHLEKSSKRRKEQRDSWTKNIRPRVLILKMPHLFLKTRVPFSFETDTYISNDGPAQARITVKAHKMTKTWASRCFRTMTTRSNEFYCAHLVFSVHGTDSETKTRKTFCYVQRLLQGNVPVSTFVNFWCFIFDWSGKGPLLMFSKSPRRRCNWGPSSTCLQLTYIN